MTQSFKKIPSSVTSQTHHTFKNCPDTQRYSKLSTRRHACVTSYVISLSKRGVVRYVLMQLDLKVRDERYTRHLLDFKAPGLYMLEDYACWRIMHAGGLHILEDYACWRITHTGGSCIMDDGRTQRPLRPSCTYTGSTPGRSASPTGRTKLYPTLPGLNSQLLVLLRSESLA